jgi:hypothetical protein
VKVWEEGESVRLNISALAISNHLQISIEDKASPPSPFAGTSPTFQLVRFAIICVLVNIAMHALYSGTLSNLSQLLYDSAVDSIWTS